MRGNLNKNILLSSWEIPSEHGLTILPSWRRKLRINSPISSRGWRNSIGTLRANWPKCMQEFYKGLSFSKMPMPPGDLKGTKVSKHNKHNKQGRAMPGTGASSRAMTASLCTCTAKIWIKAIDLSKISLLNNFIHINKHQNKQHLMRIMRIMRIIEIVLYLCFNLNKNSTKTHYLRNS